MVINDSLDKVFCNLRRSPIVQMTAWFQPNTICSNILLDVIVLNRAYLRKTRYAWSRNKKGHYLVQMWSFLTANPEVRKFESSRKECVHMKVPLSAKLWEVLMYRATFTFQTNGHARLLYSLKTGICKVPICFTNQN